MKKLKMTDFSVRRPWLVIGAVVLLTAAFALQFPKVTFDNDPENMLAADEPVRVLHNQVKRKYDLYDFVIVGVVNRTDPDGIFNVDTLTRIHDLTGQLLRLHRDTETGLPAVVMPVREGRSEELRQTVDLTPEGAWKRGLAKAFRHDPNGLFDEEGRSCIIAHEVISPSVVDNIKQAEFGSLKLEYLMEKPPRTRDDALEIRDDAMGNPLYRGTLVSEDGKAICVYIPIKAKTYSYNVANLVRSLTADWPQSDAVYITGQPVAQDTFGVEMLVQMATSAPLAGLAIFLLLLLFFRRVSLIIAPMLVAVISVVCTMGLLIGLGFDVHIMSSMIAIFLMPIAVADSVHILSEFFDTYHRFGDRKKTIRHVIGHLFRPMLYTSLTTIAGFGSLIMTPIPPVRIFGFHVAVGVGLAWLLTMTFVPAYIMVAIPARTLERLTGDAQGKARRKPALARTLETLGAFSYAHWKLILVLTAGVIALSACGISKIEVNDNPVKWFTPRHEIRRADVVLNDHFGGTYTAYLTLAAERPETVSCREKAAVIRAEAQNRFGETFPRATQEFLAVLDRVEQLFRNVRSSDIPRCFARLVEEAGKIDEKNLASWNTLADEVNYLDPQGLTYDSLVAAINTVETDAAGRRILVERLAPHRKLTGEKLLETSLEVIDSFTAASFREFVFEMEAELTAPLFKQPDMLRYVESLQEHLAGIEVVGKTSSAVDALKKAAYELRYVTPPADADDAEREAYRQRNAANYSVPETAAGTAQVYTQLEGMKKKDSLFHLVTRDYAEANIWVQLKSGDNRDMEQVLNDIEEYMHLSPPPANAQAGWAGLTYLNVVWQDKMVRGMFVSLASSFVVVLVMMMVLFRSPLYGLLSMIPLGVTIAFIYGLIGLTGKDYDMPIAVLSALTLGLSVDFAIHFLERAREIQARLGSWEKACREMFKEPAMAISRNAITISVGFTPLLMAPLVPYRTVGFFLATIMAASWVATLFILAALVTVLRRKLFDRDEAVSCEIVQAEESKS